jgi:hypothetical protein
VAFVSKMFVGQDLFSASSASAALAASAAAGASTASSISDTVFVGFCRVFSGMLSVGDQLYIAHSSFTLRKLSFSNCFLLLNILFSHVLAPRFNPLSPDSSHHRLFFCCNPEPVLIVRFWQLFYLILLLAAPAQFRSCIC